MTMNIPLNIDWQQILLHLLNFVILFSILYFTLYSPVKKFIEKRTQYYKDMDGAAEKKMQEAAEYEKRYAEKLALADSEIEQKKREAMESINAKTELSEAKAKKTADEIISAAQAQAQEERKKILKDAQNEITDMVSEATEKIIGKSTSESYDQFLTAVERTNNDD